MELIKIYASEVMIKASRSSGAGGQNVNKVNSKITLHFDYLNSVKLTEEMKKRFAKKFESKINSEGFAVVSADEHRTQKLNLDSALDKLNEMIALIQFAPKKRLKTKPTYTSKVKRLDTKKKRGDIKKMRREKF